MLTPPSDRRGHTIALSLAPMMDRTDRHFRLILRLITRRTLLYTEMVTTGALLHGDVPRHLAFDPREHPIALQLGGDDPDALARCAKLAESWGYDELNLNVGCPSERVQSGNFGACLMATPERVAECVTAMREACALPVTVKHRIGIDDQDSFAFMARFVELVAAAGADRFSVHARKAWLSGLSPKENRTVPPLRYDDVYALKRAFPHLPIELNGGVLTLDDVAHHLQHVDAVMIGRAVYDNPFLFADADARLFGDDHPIPTRHDIVRALVPHVDAHLAAGGRLIHISRHLSNLFAHRTGTRRFKQHLAEHVSRPGAGSQVLLDAIALVPEGEADTAAA